MFTKSFDFEVSFTSQQASCHCFKGQEFCTILSRGFSCFTMLVSEASYLSFFGLCKYDSCTTIATLTLKIFKVENSCVREALAVQKKFLKN